MYIGFSFAFLGNTYATDISVSTIRLWHVQGKVLDEEIAA